MAKQFSVEITNSRLIIESNNSVILNIKLDTFSFEESSLENLKNILSTEIDKNNLVKIVTELQTYRSNLNSQYDVIFNKIEKAEKLISKIQEGV